MTPIGRAIVACVALVIAGVLAIVQPTAVSAAVGLLTLIVGYALGDRNGEKRAAQAEAVTTAEESVAALVDRRLTAYAAHVAAAPVPPVRRRKAPARGDDFHLPTVDVTHEDTP
jgi:hypothetical protein